MDQHSIAREIQEQPCAVRPLVFGRQPDRFLVGNLAQCLCIALHILGVCTSAIWTSETRYSCCDCTLSRCPGRLLSHGSLPHVCSCTYPDKIGAYPHRPVLSLQWHRYRYGSSYMGAQKTLAEDWIGLGIRDEYFDVDGSRNKYSKRPFQDTVEGDLQFLRMWGVNVLKIEGSLW